MNSYCSVCPHTQGTCTLCFALEPGTLLLTHSPGRAWHFHRVRWQPLRQRGSGRPRVRVNYRGLTLRFVPSNPVISGICNTKLVVTGIRIKTIHGATGLVSNITYSDITLDAITKYGIVIEQDYLNGGPTGDPTPGVPIKHVTLNELKGTIAPGGMLKYILCASCSDFKFSNISVVATYGELKESKCTGAPSGITC